MFWIVKLKKVNLFYSKWHSHCLNLYELVTVLPYHLSTVQSSRLYYDATSTLKINCLGTTVLSVNSNFVHQHGSIFFAYKSKYFLQEYHVIHRFLCQFGICQRDQICRSTTTT